MKFVNGEWIFKIKTSFPHHDDMEVHLHRYQEIIIMWPHNTARRRSFLLSVLRQDVSMLLLLAKMPLTADRLRGSYAPPSVIPSRTRRRYFLCGVKELKGKEQRQMFVYICGLK